MDHYTIFTQTLSTSTHSLSTSTHSLSTSTHSLSTSTHSLSTSTHSLVELVKQLIILLKSINQIAPIRWPQGRHAVGFLTRTNCIELDVSTCTSCSGLTSHTHTHTHTHTHHTHTHTRTHAHTHTHTHTHLCTVFKQPFQLVLVICLSQVDIVCLMVQNHLSAGRGRTHLLHPPVKPVFCK